ncbi:prephenate dehydrogenase [Enterococcus saigonensis]|uniref:Prephenate dehydrogenase n=1 Tax=Enterococcus saigonensis TaxID=1805431 RepID=A0A679IC74_9ENTE|nr:prephenate dehydrogenase [Enterococcus saigonensis]BCA85729.1 prephenate dehydrogenase [Enterococcus saigonensis]
MKQKVLIVGLGLIGASLALAIKKEHPKVSITGFDLHEKTCKIALKKRIVSHIATDFSESAQTADIIILAVPVFKTMDYLEKLSSLNLKEDVIVTDVASTKSRIMQMASHLPFTFIGGHPMAGSHKSGITAADSNLFENAYYIFTNQYAKKSIILLLEQLLAGTRAKFVELTPDEHDQITAMLSHLPHIIAAGLVTQGDSFNQKHPRAKQLAAGGFRDITRIASSDPVMWTEILLSNKQAILQQLNEWQTEINKVQNWLTADDENAIFTFFNQAKDNRDRLPVHKNGAIPAFYDLFIDIPDEPGVIAEVTGLLGHHQINLINLKIQETREDIHGILQISFRNERDLTRAQVCVLQNTPYPARIK